MNSFILRLLMHGLIALVPNSPVPSQVTALLLDTSKLDSVKVASRCVADHIPMIIFKASPGTCNGACSLYPPDDTLCQCSLHHQEVTISAPATKSSQELKSRATPALPDSPDAAEDFSNLVNMANLNQTLNPAFLTGKPDALAARVAFPFTRLKACYLASRTDDQTDRIHMFSIHRLGSLSEVGNLRQPVAQGLVAEADVAASNVDLKLLNLDNSQTQTFTLSPATCGDGQSCVEILLENHRAMMNEGDPCDKGGVARDFAFFYDLTVGPPDWDSRLVPQSEPSSVGRTAKELESVTCKQLGDKLHGKTLFSRPVCPMAVFNQ